MMMTRQTKRKNDIQALAEMYGVACVGLGGDEELDEDDDEGLELDEEDEALGSVGLDEDDDDDDLEGSLELLEEEEGLEDEDDDEGLAPEEDDDMASGEVRSRRRWRGAR